MTNPVLAKPTLAQIVVPELRRDAEVKALALEIKAPEFIAALLMDRGVDEKEKARDFFLAPLGQSQLQNDSIPMLGLENALSLLLEAKTKKEKIMVHGDYDVDGVTATALLYQGLKACGFEVEWFIPNRFVEGYGISIASITTIYGRGAKWIISVDTGIAAMAEVAHAKSLGLKVIITDHHQAGSELPAADAILNPNQPHCPYPNKGLSGVGVAYKLMNALFLKLESRTAENFLDLVALGSLADNVPLVDENRRLVKAGMKQLSATPSLGVRALLTRVGVNRNSIASGELLFKVTPMLNAMGRMGSPAISLQLLLSESESEAEKFLDLMETENAKRRVLDQSIALAAGKMIDADPMHQNSGCIVVASDTWHEGVIGIVAARLVEKYHRPSFVLSIDAKTGVAKGSGRTITGFNLHKALASSAHLLEKWGGHYFACGLSIKSENIAAFRENMNAAAAVYLADNDFIPHVQPTVFIDLNELTEENMLWLSRFEPYGPQNELPLFYSEHVSIRSDIRIVGEKHLKLCVGSGVNTSVSNSVSTKEQSFDVIGFNLGHLKNYLAEKKSLSKIAYYPEWSHFRGQKKIQLRLVALE